MAKKLTTYVHLREDVGTNLVAFGPDSDLPDWAVEQLKGKDHLFAKGETGRKSVKLPAPKDDKSEGKEHPVTGASQSKEPAATDAGDSDLVDPDAEGGEGSDDGEKEPPSRGASEADWREFAEEAIENGYPVVLTAEMKRNDIIKACEEAGVIEAK